MLRKPYIITIVMLFIMSVAAQCDPNAFQIQQAPASGSTAPAEPAKLKVASIFPGVVTDADYNTLGLNASNAVQEELGLETLYSESVAVPDIERLMHEYIDGRANIIWTRGGQFFSQTQELAKEFPDVYFIAEFDDKPTDLPPNLWVIDRNFQVGFYPIGVLAAKQSQTGKIGYIGGLTLPFSYAEVHAIQQGFDAVGAEVEFKPAWAGDFNDPTKARELADAMLADDIDVIIGSLNLGMLGIFEAAKSADRPVWVMAKYTDKSEFAPDNYVTSMLTDFAGPMQEIVQKIMAGETGGYYPLGFGTGIALQLPLANVSAELNAEIEHVTNDVESGKIEVIKDTTPIE